MPALDLRSVIAGFCGDGANDCGALKAAHVGVSLCEAEASVAAPMTSKSQTIGSMITVIAEGRCTLMATYQIFQFLIVYAIVQAFSTNLMYTYAMTIGNYQYFIQVRSKNPGGPSLAGIHPRGSIALSHALRALLTLIGCASCKLNAFARLVSSPRLQ